MNHKRHKSHKKAQKDLQRGNTVFQEERYFPLEIIFVPFVVKNKP